MRASRSHGGAHRRISRRDLENFSQYIQKARSIAPVQVADDAVIIEYLHFIVGEADRQKTVIGLTAVMVRVRGRPAGGYASTSECGS